LSDGSAAQAATSARTSRSMMLVPAGHASMSASSMIVADATSACASVMLCAITLRTPRKHLLRPIAASMRAAR
jgi:hypothetical protein